MVAWGMELQVCVGRGPWEVGCRVPAVHSDRDKGRVEFVVHVWFKDIPDSLTSVRPLT